MGVFSKIFKRKNVVLPDKMEEKQNLSPECSSILELKEYMDSVLKNDSYIARSVFNKRILASNKVIDYFNVLKTSGMLENFCKRNKLSFIEIKDTLAKYKNFYNLIDLHNEEYIERTNILEKDYLDNILKEVDPNIILDNEQRKVVLTDEDYSLVIAGAGSGKTTTIAAKIKYLVEKKNIDPKEILVVSFTNKAVSELRDRVNKDLKIDCPITTFHSTGNAIIRKNTEEKLNIVDSSKLYFVIQDYFKNSILKNETMVNNLIMFFASYFDAPYEGDDFNKFFSKIAKSNFNTLRSDLDEFSEDTINIRTKKKVTIQSEVLRSFQEVEIANFLYLNNIEYQYEPIYKYDIKSSRKPYMPDFFIKQGEKYAYLEHFGITQDGKNSRFSDDELDRYKKSINDKILLHRKHGTKLIYTFSKYNDGRSLTEHLQEELEKNGFVLIPRDKKEVLNRLISSEESRYIRKMVTLVCHFISNFKTNGFNSDEFSRMYNSTGNVRTRLFLNICNDCYLEYERYLKENKMVDFQDMINESARILREVEEMKKKLDFKYIIVDEYQDISRQRFDLVKELSKVTDAKIIAVGDDWQSIYAFSGSDITLFTKFSEKMGYAKELKIVNTYRNSQEVIDIAGNFIEKNHEQITKALTSPKNISDPVIIYTYDGRYKAKGDDNKSGANYEMAHAVEVVLEDIIKYNKLENKPINSSILVLGRFSFDGDKLEKSGLFEFDKSKSRIRSVKYPYLNITFMTAHASKGLGYDNVIIINGKNDTYGFPSKIEDDPVLAFVVKEDRSIEYAEERRLFYVAMTRTKNRVFFVAPEDNPSEFLLEIKRDYKNVLLRGNWNDCNPDSKVVRKRCPICGYPLQYKYNNAFGLKLYICTNEPEVCGFMTNEYKADKLSIMKCNSCQDGYMIVKSYKAGGFFLGCTNYKKDGTGCSNVISKREYYKRFNLYYDDEKKDDKSNDVEKLVDDILGKPVIKKKEEVEEKTVITRDSLNHVFYKEIDLNDTIYVILNSLVNISKRNYYGVTVLIDVLRGANSKKIFSNGLDKVAEYGKLKNISRNDLEVIIEWMIDKHFILQTSHLRYPVLHSTYEGLHYSKFLTPKMLDELLEKLKSNERIVNY